MIRAVRKPAQISITRERKEEALLNGLYSTAHRAKRLSPYIWINTMKKVKWEFNFDQIRISIFM